MTEYITAGEKIQALEAEVARIERERRENGNAYAKAYKRAEAAEAEVARLQALADDRLALMQAKEQGYEAEVARLRNVLRAAYHYYPKDTPMSESMRDALDEDGAA